MNMPPKPELERRERVGQYGEVVDELTPESEVVWAKYLRDLRFARIAIRRINETTEDINVEGTTS